jgi:hypothetical protein
VEFQPSDGSDVSRRAYHHESSFHFVVFDGFVSCPRRGLTDVIECFAYGFGRGLSGGSKERFLCAWDPRSATDDVTGAGELEVRHPVGHADVPRVTDT